MVKELPPVVPSLEISIPYLFASSISTSALFGLIAILIPLTSKEVEQVIVGGGFLIWIVLFIKFIQSV